MTGRPKQTTTTKRQKPGKKRKPPKLSRLHKPEGMSLEDWQVELRRQFGREQKYRLKNVGDHPFFSEFEVINPESRNAYRVRIRGLRVGDNFCSCPDFATNTLGTCKHIEFTLADPGAEARRGGGPARRLPAALQRGLPPVRRPARGALPARRGVPAGAARRGVALFRIGRVAASRTPSRHFEEFLVRGGAARPRPALPRRRAGLRGRGARRRAPPAERGRGLPARRPQRRLQGPAKGHSLRLPARRRPVRRAGRPLPDRRRDGPRQDHPGPRRRRDHGPPLRRRARPDRLPHLAQAPVAARDRALHRPHRARSSAACGRAASPQFADRIVLQDPQLRHRPRRPRPHHGLVARPRHPRRGPAHQELEHAHRPQRQEDRLPLRHRPDRHAAGEPPGGADLHRAVRRSLSSRTDVPPAARAPGPRRRSARWSATPAWTASARRWRRSCCGATRTRCSTSCRGGSTTTSSCR